MQRKVINYISGKTKAYINLIKAYRHIESTKKSLVPVALSDKETFIGQIANPKEQNKTRADWLYAKARLYENR